MGSGDGRQAFYRIDSSRVSFREFWWGSRAGALLVAPFVKLFRIQLPSATDDPNVERLGPFEVPADALPETSRARMAPLVAELEALGYANAIHHFMADALHRVETSLVTLAHTSGRSWARVHLRMWAVQSPPREVLFTEIVTETGHRQFLWSLSSKPDLAAPPSCRVVRSTGAAPGELAARHETELTRAGGAGPIVPVASVADLRDAVERHHAVVRNFHLRRGVFAMMTAADRAKAEANRASAEAASREGSRHPEILAAVRALQDKRTNWLSAVLVLAVSLGAFVAAGASGSAHRWLSWDALLVLLPVLFFHEAGHWVAMRVFGYRNLRMFFIPFFGAAVSGSHYNVAAWKKAVVSLMGPLPGIVVGTAIGVAGLVTHHPLLLQIAVTMLALNGFNLLPILPLDGGWVVQALFTSRHPLLDVVFRALAIVGLLGLAALSQDKILMYVAIPMAVALPLSYKLARITSEVRAAGAAHASPDDQTIPAATADAIIDRVQESLPKRYNVKQKAQFTLQVFEGLNARPPRLLAALGLGFVQAAGLAAAVVSMSVFVLAQGGGLGGFIREAAAIPTTRLDPDAVASWSSDAGARAAGERLTVVANFPDAQRAAAALTDARRATAEDVQARLFGQSLLVSLPAGDEPARERWVTRLRPAAQEVFVATAERPATVRLACVARTAEAADVIQREAGDYLHASHLGLIAPWSEDDARTQEERERHARARRTYAELVTLPAGAAADPQLVDLQSRMLQAHRRQDREEALRLAAQQSERFAALRREHVRKVGEQAGMEAEVARVVASLETAGGSTDRQRELAALGPLLGQVTRVDDRPAPGAARASARGMLSREGQLLHASFLQFTDSYQGPPLVLGWLQAKGCTDFRYGLAEGFEEGEEELADEP
ncbi:MAG: site-2 protease family protein [Vicinamibacteria bacterium]